VSGGGGRGEGLDLGDLSGGGYELREMRGYLNFGGRESEGGNRRERRGERESEGERRN
jgi:hypothetical protein